MEGSRTLSSSPVLRLFLLSLWSSMMRCTALLLALIALSGRLSSAAEGVEKDGERKGAAGEGRGSHRGTFFRRSPSLPLTRPLKQHTRTHICTRILANTDRQKHRHTDTQTHRHTDTDTQTYRHTDTQTHRHTDTQTHTDTNKHTQTHGHTQTYRHIQTHRHTQTHMYIQIHAQTHIHT